MTTDQTYLEPTQESGRAFFTRGISGSVVMLNLLRFRPVADYSVTPELAPISPITGEAAYRLYPKEIVLLQHDGFAATCQLDTKLIEAAILEATGYRLEVEQKAIQVNLNEAFDAHPDDTNNQIEKAQFSPMKTPFFYPPIC